MPSIKNARRSFEILSERVDLLASRRNNILFFPFIPYHENDSWNRLINEAFPLFLQGKYDEEYQEKIILEFKKVLS